MGSPSGDMLRAHLAAAAVHFHISNFSAQAELRAVKANTSPISETKDKYGKTGNRGGHRTGLNALYCCTRQTTACTCQKNIISF